MGVWVICTPETTWPHSRIVGDMPASRKSQAGAQDPGSSPLATVPVLVVDDDPASAKLLSVLLQGEGCEVRVAGSSEEALVVLGSFHPRIIALDLVLPLMSGLLLAQQLKADPATRDIVIVAVSAFNGPEAESIAVRAGCAAYIRKPIDPMRFTQLLASHLGAGQ